GPDRILSIWSMGIVRKNAEPRKWRRRKARSLTPGPSPVERGAKRPRCFLRGLAAEDTPRQKFAQNRAPKCIIPLPLGEGSGVRGYNTSTTDSNLIPRDPLIKIR